MFNNHLFKVIFGFCGMIVLGLISLTFINSLQAQAPLSNTGSSQPTAPLPSVIVNKSN